DELFRAAEEGDLDVVKELIEDTGPEVREEDTNATLLHAAAANGHVDLVIFLLTLISPNTTDNNGQTPVHVAAREGQLPTLEVLLKDEQFNAERLDNSNRSFKDL
ncbi:ankyrin repeat domain-containing protein 54, partial [Penaeus vannamei]|uniref:ankyrin repeat domain-containing protein 54 n=2 Tax=Penaeus vannamei TaxID=6689 RepID=UPI00387F5DA0